jgi:hypothetical protein
MQEALSHSVGRAAEKDWVIFAGACFSELESFGVQAERDNKAPNAKTPERTKIFTSKPLRKEFPGAFMRKDCKDQNIREQKMTNP